jgi:hypothetical protein
MTVRIWICSAFLRPRPSQSKQLERRLNEGVD